MLNKNISESKLARKELSTIKEQRPTQKNNDCFEYLPVPYQSLNSKGVIKRINKVWLETLGYKKGEVINKWFGEFISKKYKKKYERSFESFKARGYYKDVELELVKKSKEKILVLFNSNIEYYKNGEMKRTHCTFQNITEKIKTNEEIKLRAKILDSANLAVIATDIKGKIIYWGSIAEKIYGWKKKEVLGKNITEVTPSRLTKKQAVAILEKLKKGKVWEGDFLVQRKDGSEFLANVIDSPIMDENGKLIGIIGISRDVTYKRENERVLKETKDNLEAIVDVNYNSIFLMELDGTIIQCNETLAKRFGYSKEELIGKNAYSLLPPEIAESRKKYVSDVIKSKKPIRFVDKNNNRIIDNAFYPILNEKKKVIRLAVFASDITDQEKILSALNESEEKYRRVVENSPSSILIVKDGKYAFANPSGARMMGFENPEDVIGKSIFTSISPKSYNIVKERARNIGRGKANEAIEIKVIRPDGSEICVETTSVPIIYEGEKAGLIIGVDITKQKLTNKELELEKNKLQDISDSIPGAIYSFKKRKNGSYEIIYLSKSAEYLFEYDIDFLRKPKNMFKGIDDSQTMDFISSIEKSATEMSNWNFTFKTETRTGKEKWINGSSVPRKEEDGSVIWNGVLTDITAQKMAENALKVLSKTFNALNEKELFEKVSAYITKTLGIDYTFIGELAQNEKKINVLGGFGKGKTLTPFEYELENTPCQEVISQRTCAYPKNVQQQFPKDYLLQEMEIEGYIGSPLLGKDGKPVGLMVLMNTSPLKNFKIAESLFEIFKERLSLEILRMNAEKLLAESEKQLLAIFNNTTDLQLLYEVTSDNEIKVLTANESYIRAAKYYKNDFVFEDVIGHSFYELAVEDLKLNYEVYENTRVYQRQAIESGTPVYFEEKIIIGEGLYYSESIVIPIMDDKNRCKYILYNSHNITERKKAEERIKESEKRYKEFYIKTPTMLHSININGEIIEVSNQWLSEMGYSREEVIGKKSVDFLTDISRKEVLEKCIPQLMKDKYINDFECNFIKKSGEIIDVLLSAIVELDEDGEFRNSLAVLENITERKKTEGALKESQERFRLAFDQQFQFMAILSPEGRTIEINELPLQVQGSTRDDYIGKFFWEAPAWKDLPEWKEKIKGNVFQAVNSDKVIITEDKFIAANGSLHAATATYSAIRNKDNSLHYILVQASDITERKKAEEDLVESERKFRKVLELIKLIAVMLDTDGNITFCNDYLLELSGWKREEILNKNWFDFFIPDNIKPEINGLFENTILSGELPVYYENEIILRNKSVRIISWNNIIQKDREARITGVTSIGEDITEKRIAENALKESEEKYRTLYNSMNEGVCLHDLVYDNNGKAVDYIITDVNPGYEKITGIKRENCISQKASELYGTGEPPYIDMYARVAETDISENFEAYFPPMDKHFSISVFSPGKGKFATVFEDISVRRKTEQELEKYRHDLESLVKERTEQLDAQYNFLRTLIDTIPNPVFVKNSNGEFTDVNKAFEEYYEIEKENLIGNTVAVVAHEDVVKLTKEIDEKLLAKSGQTIYETYHINKKGFKRNLMVYKATFGLHKEKPEGVAGLVIDITEQKELEEKTKEALEKEREVNEMKTNFISTASHEFRTPLTSILASADLLEMFGRKWPEDKYAKFVNKIQKSVKEMTELLEEVLTLSRADRGKLLFTPKKVNLKNFIIELIEQLNTQKKQSQTIELNYDIEEENFISDEKLLKHILQNLISNSIKYSDEDKKIMVEINKTNEALKLLIKDEGIGIPEKDLPKLFEPFYRASNSTDINGSGLGLSIVQKSVELFDGSIDVESKVNVGTKITIKIPIKYEENSSN